MNKIKHLFSLLKIYRSYLSRKNYCNYFPARLWIETSSRCNLRCGLCINKDLPDNEKGDMDFALFKNIVDQSCDHTYDLNLFHRGEPLLNKNIVPMIEYASGKGLRTRIHTNATLLDHELSRDIIKAGLDFISFSFDGYTKEIYEKNRSGSDYDRVLMNIRDFLITRKNLGSKKPYTVIQVMEYGKESEKKILIDKRRSFLKNFGDFKPDKLVIRKPHNWGGLLDLEDGNQSSNHAKKDIAGYSPCTFPWYSLTIFYDGRVFLCPQDFRGEIQIGDLSKNPLDKIFNDKKISNIRDRFRDKDITDISPCKNCDRIWRETVFGIPKEYLKTFIKDNLIR